MTTEENRKKQTEAAELDTLRAEIDRLDQELVERIHARSKVAMAIGEVKKRYSDSPVSCAPVGKHPCCAGRRKSTVTTLFRPAPCYGSGVRLSRR